MVITMDAVFYKMLDMSVAASWLAAAVILLRFAFMKAPRQLLFLMWIPVAVRLICPFSFESVFSLIPMGHSTTGQHVYHTEPSVENIISGTQQMIAPLVTPTSDQQQMTSDVALRLFESYVPIIWLVGMAAMALWAIVSYTRLRIRLREAIALEANIWLCDRVSAPFIIGAVHPRIILPSTIGRNEIAPILAHEQAHIKRLDHIWKPFAFALLAVYWFNPIIWAAYILFCRDIELACDEKVIKPMSAVEKKAYSTVLLNCSVPRRLISACPLAFGEVGVKTRIKAILNYRKPAFWLVVLTVIICSAVIIGFMTDPKSDNRHSFTALSGDCELDGVSVNVKSIEPDSPSPYIEIEWNNLTDSSIVFGDEHYIYREQDGVWVNCRQTENYIWNAIGYLVTSGGSTGMKYHLNGMTIDQPGKYRFESFFHIDGSNPVPDGLTKYRVWVEFELINGIESAADLEFKVAQIVYSDGSYSFVMTAENAPPYRLRSNLMLQTYENDSLFDLGLMTEIKLSRSNFDSRFSHIGWEDASASGIRRANKRAWELKIVRNGIEELYLLLKQKDGSYYLGYGYFDMNLVQPINEDNSSIRWLYRLEEISTADSGESIYPSFCATIIEVLENSILVEPFEGEPELSSASRIYVSTNTEEGSTTAWHAGDRVRIIYDGMIAESYPAQIHNTYAILHIEE